MSQHLLLLRVLIVLGIIAFAFFLAVEYGLVARAIAADRSLLSMVILVLYGLLSAHWLWVAWRLSSEVRHAQLWSREQLPDPASSLTTDLIADLDRGVNDSQVEQLLVLYHDQLLNRHALGHFSTDLLLRLGLLGTIIGFILMLLPVAEIEEFEPAIMQQLLSSMSGGMAVALYTTMAGLITSTLLRYQYHMLDTAAVDLANHVAVRVHTGSNRTANEA